MNGGLHGLSRSVVVLFKLWAWARGQHGASGVRPTAGSAYRTIIFLVSTTTVANLIAARCADMTMVLMLLFQSIIFFFP